MTDLLSIFKEIEVLPTNAILVTFGVSCRYTNLLTNEGIVEGISPLALTHVSGVPVSL